MNWINSYLYLLTLEGLSFNASAEDYKIVTQDKNFTISLFYGYSHMCHLKGSNITDWVYDKERVAKDSRFIPLKEAIPELSYLPGYKSLLEWYRVNVDGEELKDACTLYAKDLVC